MIRLRLRPILLLVALIAVALPASAGARVRLADPYKASFDSPSIDLAGGRLVATKRLSLKDYADVGEPQNPRRVGVFAAPVSGAGAWRSLHQKTLRDKFNEFVGFGASASASRLALWRQSTFDEENEPTKLAQYRLRAGPLDGPYASLPGCGGRWPLPSPAVDGRLVAYVGGDCSGTQVTVRDPRQPMSTARTFSFGDLVTGIALAGRYLAALVGPDDERIGPPERRELVLLDHSTRQTILKLPAPTAEDVAVQGDGTVAVSSRTPPFVGGICSFYRVEWVSPQQPTAQPLAEPACSPGVRIAAGRIAYLAGRDGDQRLILAELDRSPGHTVAQNVPDERSVGGTRFDWDGTRVAYSEARCIDPVTVVAGPDEPTETFGPLECPVEIVSDSARLALDNSLGIRVRCANGCDGALGFSNTYLAYNNTPGRFARVRVAPGKVRTVRVRLSRRQAARLRREGSVRARAVARSPYANDVMRDLVLRAGR
jgi:hypothetical protein